MQTLSLKEDTYLAFTEQVIVGDFKITFENFNFNILDLAYYPLIGTEDNSSNFLIYRKSSSSGYWEFKANSVGSSLAVGLLIPTTNVGTVIFERVGTTGTFTVEGVSESLTVSAANFTISGFNVANTTLNGAVQMGNIAIEQSSANVFYWDFDNSDTNTTTVIETVAGVNATGVGVVAGDWTVTNVTPPVGVTTIGVVTTTAAGATIPFTYSDTDETGYEYQLDAGTITAATSPIVLDGLSSNTAYSIQVRAINISGAGAWSTASIFTTDALELVTSSLTSTVVLPDGAQGGLPGNGFTCTGVDRFDDGTWLVGNHGIAVSGVGDNMPSVVRLSSDFLTIIDELDIEPILGAVTVQGVAIDVDGTYWIASTEANVLLHVTPAGVELNRWTMPNINGIALDPLQGSSGGLWRYVQSATEVTLWDIATETQVKSIAINVPYADQLNYSDDALYLSYGDNGKKGNVLVIDTLTDLPIKEILLLQDVEAIEGIYVSGNVLTVMNDGGFHTQADPQINAAMTFNVSLFATSTINLSATGLPDGTYPCQFWNDDVNPMTRITVDDVVFTSGAGSYLLTAAIGTTVYTRTDTATPNTTGFTNIGATI